MANKSGSDGQIRKTTAEWAVDTDTYLEGMRLMDTDTGVVRVSKGTTYALAWVPASGGGGDYSPPIPKSDVTDLEGDLTAIVAQAARDRHPVITFSTNTTTDADPGQATIRFNNGTIASVTEIALSDADSESIDKGDLNSRCAGILQLRTVASAATIEFLITAIVHTSWTRYTVTYLKGSLPTNGTAMTYKFLPTNAATPAVTTALAGKADVLQVPRVITGNTSYSPGDMFIVNNGTATHPEYLGPASPVDGQTFKFFSVGQDMEFDSNSSNIIGSGVAAVSILIGLDSGCEVIYCAAASSYLITSIQGTIS